MSDTTEPNLYAERDHAALDAAGNYYCRHVDRMTREDLHAKSDIAAELGWRDMEVDRLRARVAVLAAELRASDCPYPVCASEDETIGACVDSGSCGCRHGAALAKDGA